MAEIFNFKHYFVFKTDNIHRSNIYNIYFDVQLEIVDRPTFKKLNIGMFIGLLGNDITWIDLSADDIMGWIETGRMPIIGEYMNILERSNCKG